VPEKVGRRRGRREEEEEEESLRLLAGASSVEAESLVSSV
jgi:hypothetical protein